jgi:hypothetical protein
VRGETAEEGDEGSRSERAAHDGLDAAVGADDDEIREALEPEGAGVARRRVLRHEEPGTDVVEEGARGSRGVVDVDADDGHAIAEARLGAHEGEEVPPAGGAPGGEEGEDLGPSGGAGEDEAPGAAARPARPRPLKEGECRRGEERAVLEHDLGGRGARSSGSRRAERGGEGDHSGRDGHRDGHGPEGTHRPSVAAGGENVGSSAVEARC